MTVPHTLARTAAAAATAAALIAPPALAAPIDGPQVPQSGRSAPTAAVEPEPLPAPVVRRIDDGFDWGSAAVGAGGAGALLVLAGLGGMAYTSRHRVPAVR